jgi:hypothetical protein
MESKARSKDRISLIMEDDCKIRNRAGKVETGSRSPIAVPVLFAVSE